MNAVSPDAHGYAVLVVITVALYLFTRERLPLESSSLLVLIVLITGFYFFPYEVDGEPLGPAQLLSGFGSAALITICCLIMIGKALEATGALQPIAGLVSRAWASRPSLALLLTLVSVALLSAFVNDTPIVVLMIPILVGIAMQTGAPPSGMMLPMGFATIIGGMSTTIGTSTNLLVVGVSQDLGLQSIGMFDFALPAVIVGSVGLAYVWLVVPRLLPERVKLMGDASPRVFNALLVVKEDSYAVEKTLSDVRAKTSGQMRIDRIRRGDNTFLAKLPTLTLKAGDRLYLRDTPENLKHYERLLGATLYDDSEDQNPIDEKAILRADDQQLAEVVITRGSPLHLRTLAAVQFSANTGLLPLAIHRAGTPGTQVAGDPSNVRLLAGDVLLVQGNREEIDRLRSTGNVLVLDGTLSLPPAHHARRALAVFAFVVLAAASGLMPILLSALIGVGLMLALRCLSWRDGVSALPTPVIMIIVTSLALGKALVATGMAEYLASGFVGIASNLPAPYILSLFLLIMAILTNIVTNNAAAVIGTPIAVATAQQLGVDPLPFVLAVLFGANMSFATPFGYQTNLLVMSAGNYEFSDFLKAGIPLAIIMWIGFSIVLPIYYGIAM